MFVKTIHTEPEVEIFKHRDNGSMIATCPIGYDRQHTYGVVVMLDRVTGCGPKDVELRFAVVQNDKSTGASHDIWDGQATKARIPDSVDRNDILGVVAFSITQMIDSARPDTISVVTMDAHLPTKALQKYHILLKLFTTLGYRVAEKDEFHGYRMWVATREIEGNYGTA